MIQKYIQVLLRMALATAFLSAVADRFGFWGKPGSEQVVWGNWKNFLDYSNQLNFYVPPDFAGYLALIATALEIIFAFFLIIGFRTRIISIASGILLCLFALNMSLAFGLKTSFDYSVWVAATACFLLSTVQEYHFSLDRFLNNKRQRHFYKRSLE